jgi:hypothetical protein
MSLVRAARLLGALLAAALLAMNAQFFHDDAFIALRYARNLAEGHGLGWNPGDRVEGYSSFLHVVLLSAGLRAGLAPEACARGVGAISALILLGVLLRHWHAQGRGEPEERLGSALCAMWLACSYPILVWVWGGLETPLVALLCTLGALGVMRLLRDASPRADVALGAGLALGAAVLTRPDAALFVAVSGLFLLGTPLRPLRERLRSATALGAAATLCVLPQLLWRHAYYGEWVPNTYYTKLAGLPLETALEGVRYVALFWTAPPFLMLVAAVGLARERLRSAPERLYLASLCAAHTLYLVFAGGDHMTSFRLAAPLVPLGAVLAQPTLACWLRELPRRWLPVAVAAVALACTLQIAYPGRMHRDTAALIGEAVGHYIDRAWPPGSRIALNTAGSTPFFARQNVYVDMLGLNDAHIARRTLTTFRTPAQRTPGHAKGDGRYVLSLAPDYIVLGAADGRPARAPKFLGDVELCESVEFQRCYEERKVDLPIGPYGKHIGVPTFVFTYFERRVDRAGCAAKDRAPPDVAAPARE